MSLSKRTILFFWLPLALSWLLMNVEGPWVQGVMSRKPDAERQLAAFGLVMSLSITIETPIIMLLATSSALTRNRQSYRVLWRFMMVLNALVLGMAALMAFTPLLDAYLGGLINIPPDIIAAVRPGMVIMIPWGAVIGWRRFHQGILIRNNLTRLVGYGTIVRVVVSGGVALGLGAFTDLSGAVIGAWSLVWAVIAEVIYTYGVSQKAVQRVLQTEIPPKARPLTYADALRFHMPLALTSLLTLLIRPVIERGLASTPDAHTTLAAFPIIFSVGMLVRAGGFAWQEVVLALSKSEAEMRALRQFTWWLGGGLSVLMALFAFTPLLDVYIVTLLAVPEEIRPLVVLGTQTTLLLPLLTTLQSYLRALLMLTHKTGPIYQAMGLSFISTALTVWLCLQLNMEGVVAATFALTVGAVVELAYLWWTFAPQASNLHQRWASDMAGD
jgi:progressive ankylosis protein